MIVAIEGLIPGCGVSPSQTQPTAPPVNAEIYAAEWLRKPQPQATAEEPGDTVHAEPQPVANHVPHPEPRPTPPLEPNRPSPANPFIEARMRVPDAAGGILDPVQETAAPTDCPFL